MTSVYGVWTMKVTGPAAALAELGGVEVKVEGRGGSDEFDRRNMFFTASNMVAELTGRKSYDDMPEEWCPLDFSEPVLSHNEFVTPDGDQQWFVAVYDVDRVCGGPEEGGWWYDTGELVQQTAVNSPADAEALRERLYAGEFPDTGKSSSVLGGEDYRITVGIRPFAPHFPEERPRYE